MIPYKTVLFYLLCQGLVTFASGYAKNAFFRKEYTFFEATQSFYRIHTMEKTWQEAKKRCAIEGALLLIPEDEAEAELVLKFWRTTVPHIERVWLGIASPFSKGDFDTIDGRPITDVFDKFDVGEPNNGDDGTEDCICMYRHGVIHDRQCRLVTPFICKKKLSDLVWNDVCEMKDKTYTYSSEMGKCYKFHLEPSTWADANTVCSNEESYLAIIDSQKEATYLSKLTAEAPTDKVKENLLSKLVYLGFENINKDGWKTVKGVKLEESGYTRWGKNQPNGRNKELCGGMSYSGHLNDIKCDRGCFFICEHDVNTTENSTMAPVRA